MPRRRCAGGAAARWFPEGGNRERWASSCRYYSVNASVNTPRDVFRKARISRRLLILVIAGTYTSGALNVSLKGRRDADDAAAGRQSVSEKEKERSEKQIWNGKG